MADALIHRGPDGEGLFFWPPSSDERRPAPVSVGLGNRRLAVIDPSGGRQPVSNEDGTVTVVYNGEIYNYRELRSSLEAKGHRFRSWSDTEVIVHQYEEDGWRCVERFRGMFAFALWDAPKRTLLLARDRIGIKPLYYSVQGAQLVFASELWSLVRGLGRLPAIDPLALAQLFLVQYVPAPQTLFPQVFKLPAASVAIWRDGALDLQSYWSPRPPATGGDAPLHGVIRPEAELVEELRRRLDDAVSSHLVSDVPVGAFLSGGLDSSLIVESMQRLSGQPVRTFAVGFEGQPAGEAGISGEGELEYARQVSSSIGTVHRELVVTPHRFSDALPQVVAALDDPVLDPALIPTFLVSRMARRDVTVVLTGEGGDELFGGYQRYRLQRWAPLLAAVPRSLRSMMLGRIRSLRFRQGLEAFWADSAAASHLGWAASGPSAELRALCLDGAHYDQAVGVLIDRFERLRATDGSMAPIDQSDADGRVAAMLDLDLRTWLPDDLLVKVDRMAMAVSLEARVPYLDHPLVEWASALPSRYKVRGGVGKYLLKRAAAGRLPPSIVHRAKQGFSPPLGRWLCGPLGDEALERCMTTAANQLGFWDRKTVERWFGAHRRGEDDYSLLLWSLWLFALWYDHAQTVGRTLKPAPV
jgi:asparagine synthase (glutamine-hydrolysing)